MINAASSISSLPQAGANNPSVMPPQTKPPISADPANPVNPPKSSNSLSSKFTPKAIIGIIILLLIVVGSGFALYVSQSATRQAGIGDNRNRAAGPTTCEGLPQNQCEGVVPGCYWEDTYGSCSNFNGNETGCANHADEGCGQYSESCTGSGGYCAGTYIGSGSCQGGIGCSEFNNQPECDLPGNNPCFWVPGTPQNCSDFHTSSGCLAKTGCDWLSCSELSASSCGMGTNCSVSGVCPGQYIVGGQCKGTPGEPVPTPTPAPGECNEADFQADGGAYSDCTKGASGCSLNSKVTLASCTQDAKVWVCGQKKWIPDWSNPLNDSCNQCPWDVPAGQPCCPTGNDACTTLGYQCYVPDPYVSQCVVWDDPANGYECPEGQRNFMVAIEHFATVEEILADPDYQGIQACGPTPPPTSPPGGGGGGPACDGACSSNAECQETNSNWMCTAVVAGNLSFEAASPWSGPIALGNSPSAGPWESQAELVINNGTSLYQVVRKGDQGWARLVPIKTDGYPDWAASGAWSGPYTHAGLPKSTGPVQALSYLLLPTQPERTVMIALWMGNEGYVKTIPMLSTGAIDFTRATDWSGPVGYSALPCQAGGQIEATADIVIGTTVRQNLWCAGQGFVRTAPLLADGNVNWSAASAWSAATTADASGFPGTGTVRTNSLVLLPNNYVLQSLWRGGDAGMTGWTREVPVGRRCRLSTNLGSKMCTPGSTPPPSPTPVACSWLQVVTPNTPNLMPGEAALIGSGAAGEVNNFFYAVYNKDNLYTDGTPKPVCVVNGGDVVVPSTACPSGTHHLIFKNSNTTLRTESGNISRTYEQIFLNDSNWNNAKLIHAQINAYVSVGDQPWSAPVASCVKTATAVPAPTPTPSVSPSPTPTVSPSPTPTLPPSPSPVGPMCLSITMSKVGSGLALDGIAPAYVPTLGDSVNFTCGLVNGAARYEFRLMQPDGQLISLAATGRTSAAYTINSTGRHYAQCRFCTNSTGTCDQPWEPLPTIVPASVVPSPTLGINVSPSPVSTPSTKPSSTPSASPSFMPPVLASPSPVSKVTPTPSAIPNISPPISTEQVTN